MGGNRSGRRRSAGQLAERALRPGACRVLLVLGFAAAAAGAGLVAAAGSAQGPAPEWPGWGGPRRNFTSDAVGLASSWPEGGPTRLWSRPLGGGHSSILVDRGRLFTQYRPPDGSEPDSWREEEVVVALDASTGRTRWEHRYPAPLDGFDVPLGVGPHATPLIVGERLFATGTNKQLFALDKATGDVLWSHDLVRDFGAPPHYRSMPRKPGYSCSLLAYRDLIIATAGGPGQAVMAFHQDDGRVAWRSGEFAIAPASPILITVEGREQVVVFASDRVVGLDPASGTQLWSHPHPRRLDANITTPVWSDCTAPGFLDTSLGYAAWRSSYCSRASSGVR